MLGGTAAAEKLNSGLTALLLLLFFGIIGNGAAQVDWQSAFTHSDWTGAASCLPVMFLALVYHDLIPVVCQFLGFDRRRIVAALVLGSVVPLGMFTAWEAVCLGLVPFVPGSFVDPLDILIRSQGSVGGSAIAVFSVAALATSAIGITLSLSSFFRNKLAELTILDRVSLPGVDAEAREADGQHVPTVQDCAALGLSLLPPTLASMASTDIFLTATHLTGSYGMTLLYGLLPPVLAWAARGNGATTPRQLLSGGRPVLVGLGVASVVVGALQLQRDLPVEADGTPGAVAVAVQPVFEMAGQVPAGSELAVTVSAAAGQLISSVPAAAMLPLQQ
jgi:tyrosine-specific transport protein